MNRIQVACYCLLASAVLLAGLLATQLGDRVSSTAHGEMVLSQQNVTVLTAPTRNDQESLFVLDHNSGALLIYTPDVRRERLVPSQAVPLQRLFGRANIGGNGGGGR